MTDEPKFDVGQITRSYSQAEMVMTRFSTAWNLSILKEMMPAAEFQNSVTAAQIINRLREDFMGAADAGQYEMAMFIATILVEWGTDLINWANNLRLGQYDDPPYYDWDLTRVPVRVSALSVPQEYLEEALEMIEGATEPDPEGARELQARGPRERKKKKKRKKKKRKGPPPLRNPEVQLDELITLQARAKHGINRLNWLWGQVLRLRGITTDELPMMNMEYGEILGLEYQAATFLSYGHRRQAMETYQKIIDLAEDLNGFLTNRLKVVQKYGGPVHAEPRYGPMGASR